MPDNSHSLAIIGAGRLGAALGRALAARGYAVEMVATRRATSARRAARLIAPRPAAVVFGQLAKLPAAGLLVIATPDGAIADTAARLAALPAAPGRRVALHLSGALSSEILSPLANAGYAVGSLHPLLSVSDSKTGADALPGAYFCVEGQPRAARAARAVMRALGARSFTIATEHKALYHAAAALSSGHLTALFDLAAGLLARCGVAEMQARAALWPLLASAVDNLTRQPPAAALTGPFARADAATVARHLAALPAEARAAYLALGRRALMLAQAHGADENGLQTIARLLDESDE
jgi:predicted short-subunit dehydrogenase-like oxidoreductase (DUF2520 family)